MGFTGLALDAAFCAVSDVLLSLLAGSIHVRFDDHHSDIEGNDNAHDGLKHLRQDLRMRTIAAVPPLSPKAYQPRSTHPALGHFGAYAVSELPVLKCIETFTPQNSPRFGS